LNEYLIRLDLLDSPMPSLRRPLSLPNSIDYSLHSSTTSLPTAMPSLATTNDSPHYYSSTSTHLDSYSILISLSSTCYPSPIHDSPMVVSPTPTSTMIMVSATTTTT
jgi:hypothetical protein